MFSNQHIENFTTEIVAHTLRLEFVDICAFHERVR
jgi:hypothetical protein